MNSFWKTTLAAALVVAVTGSLRAADVTGKWKSDFETQIGQLSYIYELKASGTNVTGKAIRTLNGEKTEIEIKEGRITKDEISFVEPLQNQDQDIRIEYTGKVTGDDMKLHRKVGDFGETDIVAKRVKDTNAMPSGTGKSGTAPAPSAPAVSTSAASTNSVTGKWKAEFDTTVGAMKYTYDLKADGTKLTGKAIRDRDGETTETEIKEGKLAGSDVSFVEPVTIGDQEIRIEYKGKVSGDELKLNRKVGDFGDTDIVAKRVKDTKQP